VQRGFQEPVSLNPQVGGGGVLVVERAALARPIREALRTRIRACGVPEYSTLSDLQSTTAGWSGFKEY
jgi:hypothetical protein